MSKPYPLRAKLRPASLSVPIRTLSKIVASRSPAFSNSLLKGLFASTLVLLLSGCAAVVPFVEPDSQALANGRCVSCRERANQALPQRKPRQAVRSEAKLAKLIRQLHHGTEVDRAHAAFWLGESAHPDAVSSLIQHLKDESKWVRRASAKALGKIGDPRSVEALRTATRDRDQYVADSARLALRALERRQASARASYRAS